MSLVRHVSLWWSCLIGQISETWLIRARHVTYPCEIHMEHDSFPWDMTGIWDMTHSYGTWLISMDYEARVIRMRHDSFMWDMTHSCETWLIHMGHDSFIWDISMGHDSFTHFPWEMTEDKVSQLWVPFIWDMTHSYGTFPWDMTFELIFHAIWQETKLVNFACLSFRFIEIRSATMRMLLFVYSFFFVSPSFSLY